MDASLAPVARSSFPDTVGPKKSNTIVSIFARDAEHQTTKTWKPLALRAPVLILTTAICWSLIAILQFFLHQSQQNGGVIFAPRINDLPLGHAFMYLYFPTVVAVIFSTYWAWIDLETKRMEPYYQLSKDTGALGKDSLLLQYPFDFLPLVPFKAAKDGHWPVFWASFAILLVTWGLVPVQAGIFSVETILRSSEAPFAVSTSSMPADQQTTNLTLRYSQSTYGIATLNETLPPYMARNFTLAPFRPSISIVQDELAIQGTWTAITTMYSVDLYCEVSQPIRDAPYTIPDSVLYRSNGGCNVTTGLSGNVTKGYIKNKKIHAPLLELKDYMAMYIGYYDGGFADYSLDGYCPPERNSTFYAAFSQTKQKETDPPNNVTAIFCEPTFYQQRVNATVDMTSKAPITVTPLGDKEPLPANFFNATYLEIQMNGGSGYEVRGDNLPLNSLPSYLERVAATNLSVVTGPTGGGFVQPMVGLSLAVSDRPLEDYLDWRVLSKSYADAYRLLFSRAMVDVLGNDFKTSEAIMGHKQYSTQAVIVEPVFTYIAEGLLGAVSIATLVLLYLSMTRARNLHSNPSTIASIMSLVADNEALLADFEDLDCCTTEEVQEQLGNKRYRLDDDGQQHTIIEVGPITDSVLIAQQPVTTAQRRNTPRNIAKPVRPVEFSLWTSIPFVGLFTGLAIALAVIFAKAKLNGLPLPSKDKLVQNLLENYIPTAFATLIEPMWILINRLLCMLQPIEELQDCDAPAKRSIDLNYSSLPPQLVIFKALRSKHFVLAAVCSMVLLANLLAVAFAGIFNQDSVSIRYPAGFSSPFELKFVSVNGSIGPKSGDEFGSLEASGAYRGGSTQDQFLIAESNFTRGTPLPAWTDEKMLYLPYFSAADVNATDGRDYRAETSGFGAELNCETLDFGVHYRARLVSDGSNIQAVFNITDPADSEETVCPVRVAPTILWGPSRPGPRPEINGTCQRGPSATELVFVADADANATQGERDACMTTIIMGWIRAPDGSCGDFAERDLDKSNSVFVRCKPKIITGRATVQVDATGRLQEKVADLNIEGNASEKAFTNGAVDVIGQANRYIFKYSESGWHNDSNAEDPMNYFARRESNSTRLSDPNQPVPTLEDIQVPLGKAFSRLFAIWLGTNKEKLLVPRSKANEAQVQGWTVVKEQRLFVSTPMFIISEAILGIYIIVAVMVYLRRPGQYLARMPTSIASIISLFAASAAVQDMKETSHLNRKVRARHLDRLGSRYGYGSYIGGDGRVHIGIDKVPFVRVRSKTTWLERKVHSFRKGSLGGS
ncbi:uncharacterized protein J4E78_000617 [Alternaria triticimaculans]|uniref:uncharacterized protein n=1 Tax=Alternaria triticimaculans TaxID=297637 RepID=UPI0020C4941F|nr:uncharacterized protein J4E78_000617 [Alternaria triticimaculans]KAI4672117.1 hypothetical protein J4E78_000617 [Alternaria triticimaculans]